MQHDAFFSPLAFTLSFTYLCYKSLDDGLYLAIGPGNSAAHCFTLPPPHSHSTLLGRPQFVVDPVLVGSMALDMEDLAATREV